MTKQWTQRAIAALLVLFLLIYTFFQAYRYFYDPVDTEIVQEYTVVRTLETTGIAIRDEVLFDQTSTGTEFYPLANAGRAGVGEPVAELYSGERSSSNLHQVQALEDEIAMLQDAQTTSLDYANTEAFNGDIKTLLGDVAEMAASGRFTALDELRGSLNSKINSRQISNGAEKDYTERIQTLQTQLSQLDTGSAASGGTVVTAPVAGYFSNKVDGYETKLATEMTDTMTVQDYIDKIGQQSSTVAPDRIGKLVLSEKWLFAALVTAEDVAWINEARKDARTRGNTFYVNMQFDQVGTSAKATVYDIIEEKDGDYAVLLLQCSMMNDELINLRVHDVVLSFGQFTGIRIDTSTIRFNINEEGVSERGVYILDGGVVRFKQIDVVYEEEAFVLSKTHYVDSQEQSYVRLFDQVITKGTDLYDGKTIQEY